MRQRSGLAQQRVEEHRGQDDRHAGVERRGQFALLAQQQDRQHDRVDRLQVDRQLRGERAHVPQCHQRQRERQQRAGQRQREQQGEVARARAAPAGRRRRRARTSSGISGASTVSASGAGAEFERGHGQRIAVFDQALVERAEDRHEQRRQRADRDARRACPPARRRPPARRPAAPRRRAASSRLENRVRASQVRSSR